MPTQCSAAGAMLLSLAASALANAAFVLGKLLDIAPTPPLPLAAQLSPCSKALAQSLKTSEALLATAQASILIKHSDTSTAWAPQLQTVKAHHCTVVGALLAALRRCVAVESTAQLTPLKLLQ
jgi:hypothetical protein